MGQAQDDMVEGYMDGRDPDAPAPSGNRSIAYAHGFQSGRDDLSRTLSAPFHERWARAEQILAAHADHVPRPCPCCVRRAAR